MFFALVTFATMVAADSTDSRWVAPSTTEEAKPFAALLVVKRVPNATTDTVRLQPLSGDRAARFATAGSSCGAGSSEKSTAIIAWTGTATDTSLVVCAQAGPEGADYLVARIVRSGTPALKEETIVSSAIAVGAGKKSALSLGVITGLLGAAVTFVLFILQEWFKRWNDGKKDESKRAQDRIDDEAKRAQDRIDDEKKREEDRKDDRLKLSAKVMNLMVTEIQTNETRLVGFVERNEAPATLSISAAQTVLGDTPLLDYLRSEARERFAERWADLFRQASTFNTAIATHEAKAPAQQAASLVLLRQEGKALLSHFREVSAGR